MQKENVFNRELMSMVTNFFSFSYKEITRNDDLGYDTYQKIYHKFEEILKEFYEKLSSQKNYKNRIRKFQNLYLEAKGPIRITDVEEAQKSIVRIARKLSDAGELVLAGRGDDFV